jgi:hypothetical protein
MKLLKYFPMFSDSRKLAPDGWPEPKSAMNPELKADGDSHDPVLGPR